MTKFCGNIVFYYPSFDYCEQTKDLIEIVALNELNDYLIKTFCATLKQNYICKDCAYDLVSKKLGFNLLNGKLNFNNK